MVCGGPDGTKWSGSTCIGSAHQTSCDPSGPQTCVYAFADDGENVIFFAGAIDANGRLKVEVPGPLEKLGIVEGSWITSINGLPVTEALMSAYTPADPATNFDATEPTPGLWSLSLAH